MLKEVGASGQISLGKKYAGQLFKLELQANGDIVMRPVKVVPMVPMVPMAQEEPAVYKMQAGQSASGDPFYTPERMARKAAAAARTPADTQALHDQWEADNKEAIEAMSLRMAKIGSMGIRMHAWRKAKALDAQNLPATFTDEAQ